MIKNGIPRWFGLVERKTDENWVKRCVTFEVDGDVQGRLGGIVSRMMWKVLNNCRTKVTEATG